MDTSFLRRKFPLLAALVVAVAFSPVEAAAQTDVEKEFIGFTTSNVQLLYGWNFNDNLLGYDPPSRQMMTLTFNNFTEWRYGDSFFFADMQSGKDLN